MAVFTLLDPIRVTVSQLFIAAGHPEQVVRVRFVQLMALVAGLFLLGRAWGITGVAVVVDAVLLIGLIPLLHQARAYVDFSTFRLFAAPVLALAVGTIVALAGASAACRVASCPNDWLTAVIKGTLFTLVFGGLLFILERRDIIELVARVRAILRGHPSTVHGPTSTLTSGEDR
jgi:hypothetical protein